MSKLLIPGILQQQVNQQSGGGGDWGYEGTLTVGESFGDYGYVKDYGLGSMNPTAPQVTGFPETTEIYYTWNGRLSCGRGGETTFNVISIDGIEYDASEFDRGEIEGLSNPFPVAGGTHSIKLK